METFEYRTATMGPGAPAMTIEAPDRAAAVRELLQRGETPTALEPAGRGVQAGGGALDRLRSRRAMSRGEMASFVRELATALSAGLPLVPALRTIGRQGRAGAQQVMLNRLIEQVEGGKALADAMAAWGRPFGDLTVNLTRAGETSGRLAEVLTQAAELLDRDLKLRRALLGATLYPMILCVLLVGAMVVVMTFIVPQIVDQLKGAGASLPWSTRVVKGVADVCVVILLERWYVTLPMALVLGVVGRRWWSLPRTREMVDEYLLRAPVLGRLLRDIAVARFTRTLGTLTSAGIGIVTALRITKGTLGNRSLERVIDDVIEQVSAGKTVAEPLERSGYFPPMLVQIVNLGERSGRLDELLGQAATAFEDRTETSMKLFTTALPPVLVVIMAGVIGFVVMAIFMALLEMQNAAAAG
ncbi:MAG: type II secretion system F family protein [Planctomycetota bacterium]|nr:type II secretion system F family protein [Planctomycetota bacterium]